MFKNRNTATKIIVLIMVAAIFLGIVGYTGYHYSNKISDSMADIYKNNLLPIKWLNAARGHSRANEANVLQLLHPSTDKRQEAALLKEIDERAQEIVKLLGDVSKTSLDAYDKENLPIAQQYLAKVREVRTRTLELAATNKAEAFVYYEKYGNEPQDKLNETLKKLSDYNADAADKKNAAGIVDAATAAKIIISVTIAAVVIALLLGFWIATMIASPLKSMLKDVEAVAAGDLSIKKSDIDSRDEVGKLAQAFNQMVVNTRAMIKQVSQSAEQVAASSEELTAGAQQSAEASNNIACSITQVAQGSEKQVSAVNETSAIVQEISATMEEMSATATEMATMSEQTASAAIEGKTSVDRAVTQMGAVSVGAKQAQSAAVELKASSAQIGEIVALISTIAGQTNLLALNAAIEAARAGEQGRGFAVVAEEVRKLAEQSEAAAHQIKGLVGSNHDSIGKVVGAIDVAISDITQGVELVNVAGTNFGAINEQVRKVTDQVRIIAKAINEAAIGSQRIVNSIKEVESVSRDSAAEAQTVSAATEEQSASMEEIAASSQALAKLAVDLQSAVSKFRV